MTDQEKRLRQSARLMRILGWLLVVGLIPMIFIYPPGFMWGAQPEGFPHVGPAHAPSPYEGLHPYLDSFEVGVDQIIENLQLAGMLGFQARKNRWSAVADVIYMDLADAEVSSVPLRIGSRIGAGLQLDVAAQLQLEAWVVQAAGAYDVLQTDRANLGVLFGVRYFSLGSDLSLSIDGPLPPELPTTEYSREGELWDGIVGIKGQYGRKWYMPYYAREISLGWTAIFPKFHW